MSANNLIITDKVQLNPITLSYASEGLNKAFNDFYNKKTMNIVRLSFLLAACLYMIFGFLDTYMVPEAADTILLIRIGCTLFCIVLLILTSIPGVRNYLQFINSIAVFVGGTGITWMILLSETSGGYYYYAGLLLIIMWAHGALRTRFIFATVTTLLVIGTYEVVAIHLKTTPITIIINNSFFLGSAIILGLFSSYGLEYYMRIAFWQAQKLDESRKKLDSEYNRKSRELEAARQIQLAMLPKSFPNHPTVELAASMKTATEIGGDYYDFHISRNNILTFTLGDAAGHGVQAGNMVTATKILFSNWQKDIDILNFLKNTSLSLRQMGQSKLFMSLIVGRIQERTLELAGGGLPSALVYRAASRQVEQISLKGIPLGIYAVVSYKKTTIDLSAEDVVVFMTDGFSDLMNTDGEMLGDERVISAFNEIASQDPVEIIEHFNIVAKNWSNGYPQHDDITFLALKIKNCLEN
jgi:hypothetical protein